jgi:hypothetical protein
VGAFFGCCWLRKPHFRVFRPLAPMSCSLQQMAMHCHNPQCESSGGTEQVPLGPRPEPPLPTHAGRPAGWAARAESSQVGELRLVPSCMPACQLGAGSACVPLPLVLDSVPKISGSDRHVKIDTLKTDTPINKQ